MKKVAFITGAFSFSLTSLGVLFEITHWPGSELLLQLGIVLFSLVFVPSVTKYIYDKEK